MRAVAGLLAFLVGVGLFSARWWSSTLPASEYPLVSVLGIVFAAIGAFAALSESWQRLRALMFAAFMGTFGLICTALTFAPLHSAPVGTWTIGGVAGFVSDGPIPWWARIVAGFFAIVCLGAAILGVWGVAVEALRPAREDGVDARE